MSFKEKSGGLIDWVRLVHPEAMEILPIWVMDTGRLTEKRPAYAKIAVPDDYVKNIKGDRPQDIYLLIKVPHAIHEEWVNWEHMPEGIKKATGIQIEQKHSGL